MRRDSTNGARPHGTGSLLRHRHRSGAETWYGKWRVSGRQVMRALGPATHVDGSAGLTTAEAEAELLSAIAASQTTRPQVDAIDVAEAGWRYIVNRETLGLKSGTLSDYESYLRVHLVPFFGKRSLDEITVDLVEEFIAKKRVEGKAIKSIRNYFTEDDHLVFAHPVLGNSARSLKGAEAIQEGRGTWRTPTGALPRPATHIRNPHGRGRCTTPSDPRVDGPRRFAHDESLRRLRP